MATLNIEILNPKAIKALQDLAELGLIRISDKSSEPFFSIVAKLRAKNFSLSIEEISKEVESTRTKRKRK